MWVIKPLGEDSTPATVKPLPVSLVEPVASLFSYWPCSGPFLQYLAASDISPKTIQKHVDNMWALGGEFIRDLNDDPPLRKRPVEQHLLKMIEYGGPLLYHGGEDQQRSFDSTCRKLRRFLTATAR